MARVSDVAAPSGLSRGEIERPSGGNVARYVTREQAEQPSSPELGTTKSSTGVRAGFELAQAPAAPLCPGRGTPTYLSAEEDHRPALRAPRASGAEHTRRNNSQTTSKIATVCKASSNRHRDGMTFA